LRLGWSIVFETLSDGDPKLIFWRLAAHCSVVMTVNAKSKLSPCREMDKREVRQGR